MKLRNIFIAGMSALAFASCSDYLEVDAPSKDSPEDVFTDKPQIERAVNGVYASMLSSDTYGNNLFVNFCLNSDVDFYANTNMYNQTNQYRRFDCTPDGGELKKAWDAFYKGIELANLCVEGIEGSVLYDEAEPDAELMQYRAEAKVLRAIFYHDLIWMFGDVPFSFNSSRTAASEVYPIVDRWKILDKLIDDVKGCADDLPLNETIGIEHVSRELAYSLISRLALTAGGWTLKPEGNTYGKMKRQDNYLDYYTLARDYAKKVIVDLGTHNLNKDFYKVFYDECNFMSGDTGDDVIFEIPFGKESTGNVGYAHGPKLEVNAGVAPHDYGEANSSAQLNYFYRFMFDENDMRREYVNQLFYYDQNNDVLMKDGYSIQNGKWSKLWVQGGQGAQSGKNTGINYPYMRYTDVLLMFAEAVNEVENGVNGENGALAVDALRQVRNRAFRNNPELVEPYISSVTGSKESFLKAVLDERKFEFAGENMRWRDLVRNNEYAVNTFWNFYRYYAVGAATASDSYYLSFVAQHDFEDENGWDNIPYTIHYLKNQTNNPNSWGFPEWKFPNQSVKVPRIFNAYRSMSPEELRQLNFKDIQHLAYFDWSSDGVIKDQVRYSLLGYMYSNKTNGRIYIIKDGQAVNAPDISENPTAESLPVVRYILPIPRQVINRSRGQYANHYGYGN